MPINTGNKKSKLYLGNKKVSNAYLGSTKAYSSGNVVTYYVHGVKYTQEYDEGESVLSPTVVEPSLSGATFLGWSTSSDSTSVVSSLTMGEVPITLYAVFKYDDASMTTYFTDTDWLLTEGGQPRTVEVVVQGTSGIDTNKYSAATITSFNVHPEVNWRGCRTSMYYRIGSDISECFAWYDSGWTNNPTSSNYAATVTTNMPISPDQGVVPLYLRITISVGDSNAGKGRGYMNNTDYGYISLTGRSVVG